MSKGDCARANTRRATAAANANARRSSPTAYNVQFLGTPPADAKAAEVSGLMSPTRRRASLALPLLSNKSTGPARRDLVEREVNTSWGRTRPLCAGRQPATFNNRSLRVGSFRGRLFAEVTRFDIVTIEVEHECGVIIVAVLAPKPRWPIILRAGFECRGMELMHSVSA
jgi:hypothetical protein